MTGDQYVIDLALSWIEIHSVPEIRADLVCNQVELVWFTCKQNNRRQM